MRITELFTAQSIALDEALQTQEQILSRLVELQATHGNITDKEAYKKALYAREAEGSTYVDNGITVPHAKTNVVTRPSLAALRLSTPVQYNAEDDGTTDLLFAIAAPENGSLHVDMLARMMQMLMNEDFVEKLKAAKSPKEFLECIDAQEEAQFGAESFTQQAIPQDGYRILAVTACVNGIAHTYMAAEALTKAGDKLGLPTKVETNGSDGAKNILTRAEIAACDGIIVAAEKKVETARFDGKPVLFTRVDDGIHKPEELIKKIAHGEVPVFHAEGGAAAEDDTAGKDSFGRSLYKNLMNGVSHMLPFVVGGGIMIALAFLLDDYSINPANFGMNTPVAAFFKTVGNAAFGYMLPILAGFIAMSIADRPGLGRRLCRRRAGYERHKLHRPCRRQHHRHLRRLPCSAAGRFCSGLHRAVPQKDHRKAARQPERYPPHAHLPAGRHSYRRCDDVRREPGNGHDQHRHDRLAERTGRQLQGAAGRHRGRYDERGYGRPGQQGSLRLWHRSSCLR